MPLNVEDEGRIVSTQDVTLPADGESATVRVRFTADDAGRAAVPVQGAGRRPASRSRRTTRATRSIEVSDRAEKVLYFEGEPRFEMKFIRRAVEDDKNLQVVILQRTAENKYLPARRRQPRRAGRRLPEDARGAVRLPRDHPRQRRSGVVHARQLRMLADFVSKRGGGLLMLGGRRSFAEGGWAGTPVGEVLPVVTRRRARSSRSTSRRAVGAADARRRDRSR